MYKYILEQAGDIDWMALVSLLTFFIVFSVSVILVMKKSKSHIQHMANLPLENDTLTHHEMNSTHEK